MELANHLILIASGLILVSIFAGTISTRFGAPLLLVFLVLGMLAGEDGPGGIDFDDFRTTYAVGSVALAIILFDGGLRTRWAELKSVALPAGLLASLGVLVTAALTGFAAAIILQLGWLEGMLIGAIVASTDAAAVFLLLHLRGMRLRDRVRAVLEAEAGLNDPMAVLLTIACVGLLTAQDTAPMGDTAALLAGRFALQILGGAVAGLVGGGLLLALINRISVASGLYPVLAAAGALLIFAASQEAGASGFLAAYLAGLVVGNSRHKATMLIDRFLDGLAWLAQIVMFLILGLLVTPSMLQAILMPSLLIAAVLIFVARPAAVALLLPWFKFQPKETLFVSWVGLRGAVPIFLGTIPVLAGIENAQVFFGIVYIVVMASLIVQGWTVGIAGRRLGVALPPRPEAPPRVGIDLPSDVGRDMTAYTVQPRCLALRRPLVRLPIPEDVDVVSIIRDGKLHAPAAIEKLAVGDDVLVMSPASRLPLLDYLFGARPDRPSSADAALLGEFSFAADVSIRAIADIYGFRVPGRKTDMAVGAFLSRHLVGEVWAGRRLSLGKVELIVGQTSGQVIVRVNIELDPPMGRARYADPAAIWLRSLLWFPLADAVLAFWAKLRDLPGPWRRR